MCTLKKNCNKKKRNAKIPLSSNVNEVIGAISNLFIFFYEKISHAQKAQKARKAHKKHKNANNRISDFFPLRCFFKRIKTMPFLFLFAYMRFVLFVRVKSFCKKTKLF